jgi:lysophospholipase L1-like esterase
MTQIFKDTKEQVYADELHFNAAGNRIIAETLLKNIIEMMKN